MKRFKKVLIASVMLSGLLLGSLVIWFVVSNQQPPFQRVPFSYKDFMDYPQELVVNRSQGEFRDYHTAIASGKWTGEVHEKEVFLGLKLTGFWYTSSLTHPIQSIGYFEGIVVSRLDALVTLSNRMLKIEELSLSCRFNESLNEEVLPLFIDPLGYNLQLIQMTKGYASPSEPFIIWKGVDNYYECFFTDNGSLDLRSYNNSTTHQFIITLTLTYSVNSSMKRQISTSLYIVIKD